MENITVTEVTENELPPPPPPLPEPSPVENVKETPITSIEVVDENVALNLIITFLSIAQKRGAFTIDESAKIWECIKKFVKTP
jgi:hypothetical protein